MQCCSLKIISCSFKIICLFYISVLREQDIINSIYSGLPYGRNHGGSNDGKSQDSGIGNLLGLERNQLISGPVYRILGLYVT